MRTSSLLANRPLKPREVIAHLVESIRATCRPGTMRRASGMLVAPERRMSSAVRAKMAADAFASFCGFFAAEVTSSCKISSILISVKSTPPELLADTILPCMVRLATTSSNPNNLCSIRCHGLPARTCEKMSLILTPADDCLTCSRLTNSYFDRV